MFQSINNHKYLEMITIQETNQNDLAIILAVAEVSKIPNKLTHEEEPNDALRKIINKSYPIEVNEESIKFEIIFDDYIAYAVTNESFAVGKDEEFEGRLARVYSKSAFLDYIKQGTFATFDYPGPFKHYGFCCLNHIIDIVSEFPPSIKVL